jgi:hypothetical protein
VRSASCHITADASAPRLVDVQLKTNFVAPPPGSYADPGRRSRLVASGILAEAAHRAAKPPPGVGLRSKREREGWNSVRRALSFVPADAHILRSIRDRAPLHAQSPHNSRVYSPRAPHLSALHLAPSAVDAHLAGGAAAMANEQDAIDAARSLDADLACIARRTPERAHVLDGAYAPLFSERCVERRVGLTSLLVCRHAGHPRIPSAHSRDSCLRSWSAPPAGPRHCRRAASCCRLTSSVRCAHSCLRSIRRTMNCVVAAAERWTMHSASFRLLGTPSR